MAKQIDWKIRWVIMVIGIAIMMFGQGNLLWIVAGASVALAGIYYGVKDWLLDYFKKLLARVWKFLRGFLPPF